MTEDWTDDFVRRVANEINNLRSAGLVEPQEIADMLNVQEMTTRNGGTWTATMVAKFLDGSDAKRSVDAK